MTTSPPAGLVLHRICASCDREVADDGDAPTVCPSCGGKLVEIRSAHDELIGAVIDNRFEIRDLLGEGGMGTVYRAWQRSVGREVAIKLIDRRYSRDPMAVRRFLREARLASQLSQPNTVSVFDFGQSSDGRLFIAMELIRGKTLAQVLKADGRFGIARAARIGVQICDALEAAHALKIVHRDLKLENVIVLDHPAGRDLVKVLDFGLAKTVGDDSSRGTQSGVVVGTPRYMAPEAAMNGTSLPPGDLYAVGVILAELTSGAPLWTEDSFPALVASKLEPERVIHQVPLRMRALVGSLIAAEPEGRPDAQATRVQLIAMLDEVTGDAPIEADARPPLSAMAATVEMRAPSTPTPAPMASPALTPSPIDRAASAPLAAPAVVAAPSEATPVSPSMARELAALAPRAKLGMWLAGFAVVAVAGGVVYVITRSRGGGKADAAARVIDAGAISTSTSTSTSTSLDAAPVANATLIDAAPATPDAAPAAPAIDRVVLHLRSQPSGASLTVDGHDVGFTPLELPVVRGGGALAIDARLGGRVVHATVVPDQDRDVMIDLSTKPHHGGGNGMPF